MSDDSYDDDLDDSEAPQSFFAQHRVLLIGGAFVLVFGIVAVKMLRGTGGGANSEKLAVKLTLANAEKRFAADSANPETAASVAAQFEAAGEHEKALSIQKRHEAAMASQGKAAEQTLRAQLAKNPKDGDALIRLVNLLLQSKHTDDARAAYQAFVDADPTPQKRSGYGAWLWKNGYAADAETALRQALKAGDTSPHTHGFLGLALFDLGKNDDAKKELNTALEGDPDQDIVRAKLVLLEPEEDEDTQDKPAPPPKKAKSKKKGKKK
jgi:tetratricopeptide (TPR) repeat protein